MKIFLPRFQNPTRRARTLFLGAAFLAGTLALNSAWALEIRDLPGKWKDPNNIEYQVEIQGTQFILRLLNATDKACKVYQGPLLAGEFNIICRPRGVDDLGKTLPLPIRQALMARGYQFRATVDTSPPNDLHVTFITDSVTYDRGGTTVSSVNLDDEHENLVLSRRRGYQIGNIAQDPTLFHRRAEAAINEFRRRIEHIRRDVIPPIEIELASQQQLENHQKARIATQERERDLATAHIEALEAEIANYRSILETDLANIQSKYPLLADHRNECLRKIRELETRIIRPSEIPNPDTAKFFEERAHLTQELVQIESALREHLGDILSTEAREQREADINRLFQEAQRQTELRKQINDRIIDLRSELDTLQQNMLTKLAAIETQENSIQALLKEIDSLAQPPALTSMVVMVGPDPKFYASLEQDQQVLAAMQAQQLDLDTEIRQMPDRVQALRAAKDQARSQKNAAKWSMTEAAHDVIDAEADIVTVLEANRRYRAAAATAAYFYDVISAGVEGGPAGIFADLTGKLVEHYALNDQEFFKSFDESELRAAYAGIQVAEPSMREQVTESYPFGQACSSTVEFMESAFQNEFSTLGALYTRDQARVNVNQRAMDLLREQDGFARRMGQEAVSVQDAYERVLRNPGASAQEMMEAVNNRRSFLSRYRAHVNTDWMAAAPLEKANRQLDKANKAISDLRKIDLKDAAKGVGKGLLVDTFKGLLTAQFDAMEQEAWTKFFEKEVYYKLEFQKYRLAAANYWLAYDRWKDAQRYWQLLWTMSKDLSADMQSYANRRQDGFHVAKNEPFYDDQGPVEMKLEILGPTMGEETFLLGDVTPSPPKELKGQPQASESPSAGVGEPGHDAPEMPMTQTSQRNFQFMFDPAALKTLKPGGELPVKVLHQ